MRSKTDQLATLQSTEAADQQQIQQQVAAVENVQNQALQDQASFQAQAAHLTGPAATLTRQLQGVLGQLSTAEGQQVATVGSGATATGGVDGALPPFAFGPRVDDFAWGQCTWYVASLREVTWGGDAWQWIADAARQNKPEGMTPKPGAIVVFGPGNGSSAVGHVAYVETVVSPTSFIVDESNVLGLGVVDKRVVGSLFNVEGFIY
jgi:surface antigen